MGGRRMHQHSPPWSVPSDGDYGDDGWSTSEAATATKEQDGHVPIANVGRIMKKSLPASAKISKEAKGVVQECVSEFIGFVTGEASDKCRREKRKTVNGDDLLWAMTTLGFESYAMPLKAYMDKYREISSVIPAEEENSLAATEGSRGDLLQHHHYHYSSSSPMVAGAENNAVAAGGGVKENMTTHENSSPASRQGGGLPTTPEIYYCFGEAKAPGCVGGGMVGERGQGDHSVDFTITVGESSSRKVRRG